MIAEPEESMEDLPRFVWNMRSKPVESKISIKAVFGELEFSGWSWDYGAVFAPSIVHGIFPMPLMLFKITY